MDGFSSAAGGGSGGNDDRTHQAGGGHLFLGGCADDAMPVSSRCSSPSSSSSSSSPTTTITATPTETGADAVAQRRSREANDEGSVDRRREFARLQDARRRAYRETTSLRVFPLQAMAMEDHRALMRGYHHHHRRRRRVDDASDDDDDDADGDGDDDVSSVGGGGGGGEDSRSSSNKKGGDGDDDDAIAVDVAAAEAEAEAEAAGEQQPGRVARRGRPRRQRPPPRDDAAAIIATKSCSTLWSFEPRLFAMETSVRGRRRYLSGHLGRFVDRYWRECDVGSRHYYELIKEGSPCRLYFGE